LSWFDSEQENAHICPLDRTELFLPRIYDDPTRTIIETASGLEVIAGQGLLRREGCRHVIHNLWIATSLLAQDVDGRASGLDEACVSEILLCETIRGVFLRGVATMFAAWPRPARFARLMIVWHGEGGVWADAWQGPM
jgi:hypothetical protein